MSNAWAVKYSSSSRREEVSEGLTSAPEWLQKHVDTWLQLYNIWLNEALKANVCICVCACPNAALPRCLLVVLSNIASRHRPADKTHTQREGWDTLSHYPAWGSIVRLWRNREGQQMEGRAGRGTERERERRTERKRIWWRREKGAEIKEEKVMAVNTLKRLSSANNSLCSYVSQLVWLQDPDVTLDIKWQIKRLPKLSVIQNTKYFWNFKSIIVLHLNAWFIFAYIFDGEGNCRRRNFVQVISHDFCDYIACFLNIQEI